MSLSFNDLRNILDTTGKTCPTGRDFVMYILPIFTFQYMMGVLVQLKHTTLLRIAVLPVILWAILRALSALDFSCGQQDQGPNNAAFFTYMTSIVARATVWTLARQPYKRDNVGAAESTSFLMACWNAWDLLLNVRGIGWNWSQGTSTSRSSNKSRSRALFVLLAVTRLAFSVLALDALTEVQLSHYPNMSPRDIRTIFDHSLPPIPRYIRVLNLVYLNFWMGYFTIEGIYQLLSAIFAILFWQHPSQWPPMFDKPWSSTSLNDLWGRRWHQILRHFCVALGGAPLAYLLGRPGNVLGTFLLSGAVHCIQFRANGHGGNLAIEGNFFVMNGIGILLERTWSKMTGRRVRGLYGWMWTLLWVTIWAVPMVDQWAEIGRFGFDTFGGSRPAMALLSLILPTGADKSFAANCLYLGISVPLLVYTLFTLS